MTALFGKTYSEIRTILNLIYGEIRPAYVEYNADDPEDKRIANLFGWNKITILHAIECYDIWQAKQIKENKMTREEAITKLCAAGVDANARGNIILALEALGLIKFEEANKAYDCRDVILDGGRSTVAWKVIKAVQELGYKVTKI